MYKIRVILDAKKDVLRTILVKDTINLETLHQIIAKSFGFDCLEMASFFKVGDTWQQGDEIPLVNMSEDEQGVCMRHCFIREIIPAVGDKLIYVYDFLEMWTFYVETIEIRKHNGNQSPKIILSIGQIPEKAPKKIFISENTESYYHKGSESTDTFESFDDIDSDVY